MFDRFWWGFEDDFTLEGVLVKSNCSGGGGCRLLPLVCRDCVAAVDSEVTRGRSVVVVEGTGWFGALLLPRVKLALRDNVGFGWVSAVNDAVVIDGGGAGWIPPLLDTPAVVPGPVLFLGCL